MPFLTAKAPVLHGIVSDAILRSIAAAGDAFKGLKAALKRDTLGAGCWMDLIVRTCCRE